MSSTISTESMQFVKSVAPDQRVQLAERARPEVRLANGAAGPTLAATSCWGVHLAGFGRRAPQLIPESR